MRIMNSPQSQLGFGLLEMMVAIGLLGGMTLVTMQLYQNQAANQAYIKAQAEINKTGLLIESYLSDPARCLELIGNAQVSAAGSPLGVSGTLDPILLKVTNPANGAEKIILSERDYGEFTVEDNAVVLRTSSFGASMADVVLSFKINNQSSTRNQNAAGKAIIVKTIPLIVSLSGGRIKSCGGVLQDSNEAAKEQLCSNLSPAGTWDAVTKKCTMVPFQCPVGEVITGMTKLGSYTCGSLLNKVTPVLDRFFDTSPIDCTGKNTFNVISVGGKYKINCM